MADVKSAGVGLVLLLCLACAYLACASQGAALPSLNLAPKAVSVPHPRPGENINSDLALDHIKERHPAAVAAYEAIMSGQCEPRVYQGDGCEPYGDGARAYLVCAIGPNTIVIPMYWDAIAAEWVPMTGMFTDESYVNRVTQRDGCRKVPLDVGVVYAVQRLIYQED